MVIKYYTKNVYGNELTYMASARDAQNWYEMTGKRTITEREKLALMHLTGCTFERVFEAEK